MTWNVWWRFGPWEARQPGIAAELRSVGADVVCLQEVWADAERDQAQWLAHGLGYHLVRTAAPGGGPQRFGNAILSRFPLEPAGQLTLPSVNGDLGHRTALAAWVRPDPVADRERQLLVTTHLEWRYDASALRQQQLAEVVGFVADLVAGERATSGGAVGIRPGSANEPDEVAGGRAAVTGEPDPLPVILAGDFNAQPDSQEIRRLTGMEPPYRSGLLFTDVWAVTNDDPGHTWTRDNDNAGDAMFPRRRLDYVFVSWPRTKPYGNPLAARLAGTEPHGDTVPSDHYAVVAELDDRTALG